MSSNLEALITEKLVTSWREGVCDGLEIAAQMAELIVTYDEAPLAHAVLTALAAGLRQQCLDIAAGLNDVGLNSGQPHQQRPEPPL